MRKKLLAIIAMAFGLVAPAMAETVPCMRVLDAGGNAVFTWPLEIVDEIELGSNGVTFKSLVDGNQEISYGQIQEIEIGEMDPTPTSIDDNKVKTVASVSTDMVQLTGAPINASVAIYDMNGREVVKNTTDGNGTATISLSNLAHGAYVIKVNNYTLKFVK